jgi:hypothetical protein
LRQGNIALIHSAPTEESRLIIASRHSGAMPTGPASGRPDDKLRIEPGISRFPDAQLRI